MTLTKSSSLEYFSINGSMFFKFVFIILLAYAAARLTWLLFEEPEPSSSHLFLSTSLSENRPSSRGVAVNDLIEKNLFGQMQSISIMAPSPETVEVIPDTQLRVRLLGVFASNDDKGARAIIANTAGKERAYSAGDILEGNAVVKEIYANHVVILHKGRKEILRILWDGVAVPQRITAPTSSSSIQIPPDIAVFRDALFQGSDKLKAALGAKAVKEGGSIVGFQVNQAASRAAARFGVRQGDILMTVNGVKLDSEVSLDRLLKRIPTTTKYQVQLRRNGRIKDITIGR